MPQYAMTLQQVLGVVVVSIDLHVCCRARAAACWNTVHAALPSHICHSICILCLSPEVQPHLCGATSGVAAHKPHMGLQLVHHSPPLAGVQCSVTLEQCQIVMQTRPGS